MTLWGNKEQDGQGQQNTEEVGAARRQRKDTGTHCLALLHGMSVDVGVGQPQDDVAVQQAVQRKALQEAGAHQPVPGQDVAQQLFNTHGNHSVRRLGKPPLSPLCLLLRGGGGRNSSLVMFGLAVHSVAGSILLWGHFPVEGIFPLELTWVQTPFPPKLLRMRV